MIGLLTSETAIRFSLGKPVGKLQKANKNLSNLKSAGVLAPSHHL